MGVRFDQDSSNEFGRVMKTGNHFGWKICSVAASSGAGPLREEHRRNQESINEMEQTPLG